MDAHEHAGDTASSATGDQGDTTSNLCCDIDTITWLLTRHHRHIDWELHNIQDHLYAILPGIDSRALPGRQRYGIKINPCGPGHPTDTDTTVDTPEATVDTPPDLIVATITGDGAPPVQALMRVPYIPEHLTLPDELTPPAGWSVTLSAGYSRHAIADALQHWIHTHTRRNDLTLTRLDEPRLGTPNPDRVQIGEHAWATHDAFDTLLDGDIRDTADYETYVLNVFDHIRRICTRPPN